MTRTSGQEERPRTRALSIGEWRALPAGTVARRDDGLVYVMLGDGTNAMAGHPDLATYGFEERCPMGSVELLGAAPLGTARALASLAEVRVLDGKLSAIIPAPRSLVRVVGEVAASTEGQAVLIAEVIRRALVWGVGAVQWDETASLGAGFVMMGLRHVNQH